MQDGLRLAAWVSFTLVASCLTYLTAVTCLVLRIVVDISRRTVLLDSDLRELGRKSLLINRRTLARISQVRSCIDLSVQLA